MKPKNRQIKSVLTHLANLREDCEDPAVARIAQGMETALRWVTEDTVGWKMKEEPFKLAECLREDLKL